MTQPTSEHATIRSVSDALVELQRPIRILDAVKWSAEVKEDFFAHGATRQPLIDADYYLNDRPLGFEPDDLITALGDLTRRVGKELGSAPVAGLLIRRLHEYQGVVEMLRARGTSRFSELSAQLYGGPGDVLHVGGPTLQSLGQDMDEALSNIASGSWDPPERVRVTAEDGVKLLNTRLGPLFEDGPGNFRVILDDGIVADATAGGDYIKLNESVTFSKRQLRILEVHEGWVHVGTSLNGQRQECCTFLGKGTPSTTATQEGLAVFIEVTSLSSNPDRLRRLTRRITAIAMTAEGATFLDVYRWFIAEGHDQDSAWSDTVRVFRGSTPDGGAFTKDLVYSRGFLEVYDVFRLAVRRGQLDRLPLLFAGKLAIDELSVIQHLSDEGLITPPEFLPPNISDLSALASWMAYSSLLNRIDLDSMEAHLEPVLGEETPADSSPM